SILFDVYADQNKVAGVNIPDPQEASKIYNRYLEAFKTGVYNYIKEEQDTATQEMIPRKYFSGGVIGDMSMMNIIPVPSDFSEDVGGKLRVTVDVATRQSGRDFEKEDIDLSQTSYRSRLVLKSIDLVRQAAPIKRIRYFFSTMALVLAMLAVNTPLFGQSEAYKGIVNSVLQEPLYSTVKERRLLAGTGKPAKFINDRKSLVAWLTLTGDITVHFVPREHWSGKFSPKVVKNAGTYSTYHYTLPKDIKIIETLSLIRSIRALPSSPKGNMVSEIAEEFRNIARYLAKQDQEMTPEREEMIRIWYALGLFLDRETMEEVVAPQISAIAQEAIDSSLEKEILSRVGLKAEELIDMKKMMARVIALSVQGMKIKLEIVTYGRGIAGLKNDIRMPGVLSTDVFKAEVARKREDIQNAKARFGDASPEATRAEIAAIEFIKRPIEELDVGYLAGEDAWASLFKASPSIIRSVREFNCIGKTVLTVAYLEELGVDKVWSVTAPDHIFLLAQLSDGQYFFIDTAEGFFGKFFKAEIPKIPSGGVVIDADGQQGYDYLTITPWRYGVGAAFYNNLGTLLNEMGRTEESLEVYKKAIMLNPKYDNVYYNLGNYFNNLGRNEEAIAAYQMSTKLNPKFVSAYNNLGNSLGALGRHEEALEVHKKAIMLNPENAILHYNAGNELCDLGRNEEAIAAYQMAIKLNPKLVPAYNRLGDSFHKFGRYGEALVNYKKAIELDPKKAFAFRGLGEVLYDLHRYNEAVVALKKALKLNPKVILRNDTRRFIRQYKDPSMSAIGSDNAGGIDLTSADNSMQVQNKGDAIKFHLDPARLEALRRATGFTPVIINIQPMTDMRLFMGLRTLKTSVPAV
ncbi:MAG: tetratricopeptide repeat protein, partial [Candidatus Omnitrophota bacterium]